MTFTCPFVLASASPRRRTLLDRLGLPFEVDAADVPEDHEPALAPDVVVEHLATRKAEAVAARHPDALVLGADTIVVDDGSILGKPSGPAEASSMLQSLSGRTHQVYTGIALIHHPSNRTVSTHAVTDVTFGDLTREEIDAYVASGSPLDKAGSYGIQDDAGAWFIEGIQGDFYNVVGLPLRLLYRTLRKEFTDLLRS